MRIEILENCYAPRSTPVKGALTIAPSILERGTFVDLPDDQAKTLIEKGFAVEVTETVGADAAEAPKKKAKKTSDESDK